MVCHLTSEESLVLIRESTRWMSENTPSYLGTGPDEDLQRDFLPRLARVQELIGDLHTKMEAAKRGEAA